MNKIYDNGQCLLGKVKDILDYVDLESLDDETTIDLVNDLKEYNKESIVFIDYDNPMSYSIDEFTEKDIIKESE